MWRSIQVETDRAQLLSSAPPHPIITIPPSHHHTIPLSSPPSLRHTTASVSPAHTQRLHTLLLSMPDQILPPPSPTSLSPFSSPHSHSYPPSSSSSLTIPFVTIGGFAECSWYRRALCIAEEFLHRPSTPTAFPTPPSDHPLPLSPSSPPALPLPLADPAVRIEAVTLPRQSFRHYLLHLMKEEQIDLGDHYSCPVILEGTCTLTPSPDDTPSETTQHDMAGPPTTSHSNASTAVSCECHATRLVGGYVEWERLLRERYGFVSQRCGRVQIGGAAGAGC